MSAAQSFALQTLALAAAIAPLIAMLCWSLRRERSLSEIIKDARQ